MGIYHFMGLGFAVGAVTCAVDYIEKALDLMAAKQAGPEILKLFHGSGGVSHAEMDKGKIEALVLFTSKEVIDKEAIAKKYTGTDKPGRVREEILRVLKKVWRRADSHAGRKIFWCEVDIDNFQDCFDKIVKVAYRFSPPGKQGKEIWCNLTGGANSINIALLAMANLTGLSTTCYLISQRKDYQQEITVPNPITIAPNKDGYFNVVPYIKTQIDTLNFYEILMELESVGQAVTTEELYGLLKSKPQFAALSFDEFKKHYMLKLHGLGYTDYNVKTDANTLNASGFRFIAELEKLETAIELESKLLRDEIDMIAESKNWAWFQEIDILNE